ncbi:Type cbb3 cytochrome oxidase biogenesis protein CcoS, involved in heme b insertion [hydrothermal vent metagenome]|uniref:Type cbb3 cytochrome oxidase biogenesis protein CcoS, involved in heme b insertion n=1 Tax=hydrothermal vent metagenome TaxID=652676 RepID=A0A3B0W0C4_9ZZZZ
MSMIFILVIMSLILVGFAIWAFFWAIKNNQFDDLDTPAYSILEDNDQDVTESKAVETEENQ